MLARFLRTGGGVSKRDMATFFESGTWVWIPDEDEVVLPAKAKSAFRLGERATVVLESGAVRDNRSKNEILKLEFFFFFGASF